MKYLLDGEETERLSIRNIEEKDFDSWLKFFSDPSSFTHWICELEKPEIECQNWYKKQFDRYANDLGGMNAMVEKKTGTLIGHAGLLVQQVDQITELEVAYSLLPGFRNQGYATEAAKKCKDFAFQNSFSLSLISIISLTNIPSANVARKNGMKVEKQTLYHGNQVNIFRAFNPYKSGKFGRKRPKAVG